MTDCCEVCQIPAKQLCSACKLVKYCSAEHQRQHWKQHKLNCRPFSVANDSRLGRHLIATREIKKDTVIFVEAPLIVGPKWYLTLHDEQVPVMPCVGCFTPCRIGIYECPRCHWPACSADCLGLNNPQLHALECSVLMLGSGPAQSNDLKAEMNYYRSDALLVLKCLLLQRLNPKKWQEFMDMQSHEKERLGSELHKEAEERIVSYLQRNFLQRLKSVEQQTKEQYLKEYDGTVLHRICGIIETNYMCINVSSGLELSGVFYMACMMEHACLPNCYFKFDENQGFRISVIAGRDISKGEHLQIMYSNMLWGTHLRQEHLAMTKHFQCCCVRCSDATEFGSNFSALICVGDVDKECGGIQLPKEPLNVKTDWACAQCPMIISGDEVRYLLTQINDEVEALLANKPTVKQLETLIEKLSKFLHAHHYHMFSLKHSLIQLYGNESAYTLSKMSEALLSKKELLCKELYEICQRLDPHTIRLSIYVGIILFEWHTVHMEKSKRILSLKQEEDKNPEAMNHLKKAHEYLQEAVEVLHKELDSVTGSKLIDAVHKAKTKVEEKMLLIKTS